MNPITRTIQEVTALVNGNFSSVFTKQDVLDLIQSIEVKKENPITREMLVDFVSEYIETQVNQLEAQDIVDFSSAQFDLNGCELSLEDVDIDSDDLRRNMLGEIDDAVNHFLAFPEGMPM
jgi:hypothetical protein